jgi:phosphoheptose isomerase
MNAVLSQSVSEAVQVTQSLVALSGKVATGARLIADAFLAGNKILVCGNGGSAAEAAHLTTEFVCRFNRDRPAYPAICLSTHGGDLTAIGNDYAFNNVFARQVEAFARPGDVLIALSSSGNSENVLRALRASRRANCQSIALLGHGGGLCAGLADIEMVVSSTVIARIQEAHLLIIHTMCELIEAELAKAPAAAQ